MTRIWWILIWALKSLKNLHFDWSLLCKVYNVWPKKVQRSIFHDTEESCKIWRKTDLWFGKWHEEFGKFSSEHLKVSKLVFSWDPFVQSIKCMSYKLTEELQVMTLKNGEKSEEELTCHFKIDIKNLRNFDSRTQCLKNYLTKLYNVWAKKVQRSYVWLHSRLKENWLVFPEIHMRKLVNFHRSTWKSPNWDLDDILLSEVENVWA